MKLQYYISSGRFDEFCKALNECQNLLEKECKGETVLHVIARKKEENFVKTFFSKKLRPSMEYIAVYEARLRDEKISMKNALSIQDDNGDTPIHRAIACDNWQVAKYFSRFMGYGELSPSYFRNSYGLTEYEYALLLYGLNSRAEEIRDLFVFERYSGGFSMLNLLEIKKAAKAFKFIEFKGSDDSSAIITSDDPLFSKARESDYPYSSSSFDEECDLAAYCKNNGLRPYEYVEEYKWPLVSVDDLLLSSKVENDKKIRFYSFICEFYSYVCYQVSDNPNMRNMAIIVVCDNTNEVGLSESDARWLEAVVSRFMETRSPSRQEAYWPFVERIYNRSGVFVLGS
ncbi:hypothetical protein PH586_17890 [Pseudomonas sp. SA3-5]|uniref:Ankyrin repeat domain-containing protein n=1 Tax=Pseudomonas aestuarii TaxID=3018340 RepID=A0ABT4XJ90_9PSED|nr:hypothetical protein [Pseudomonas aestuarii]MDA7088260.1 hypothetical protein [Pseudomonas aestuarii]